VRRIVFMTLLVALVCALVAQVPERRAPRRRRSRHG
jgi:hypothetical protein